MHPPDVIVAGLSVPVLSQRSLVDDGTYAKSASPVVSQRALIGPAPRTLQNSHDFTGILVTLVATDDRGLAAYGVGRLDEASGGHIAQTLASTSPLEANPIELPGTPQILSMSVTLAMSQDLGPVTGTLRGVIRDSAGIYETVELGAVPVDGQPHNLEGNITAASEGDELTAPLYLVGIQTQWAALDVTGNVNVKINGQDQSTTVALDLSVDAISSGAAGATIPVPDVPSVRETTPVAIPSDAGWTASGNGIGVVAGDLSPHDGEIQARGITTASTLVNRPVSLALTASAAANPVPLVVTGSVLDDLGYKVGDRVQIQVEDTLVPHSSRSGFPWSPVTRSVTRRSSPTSRLSRWARSSKAAVRSPRLSGG